MAKRLHVTAAEVMARLDILGIGAAEPCRLAAVAATRQPQAAAWPHRPGGAYAHPSRAMVPEPPAAAARALDWSGRAAERARANKLVSGWMRDAGMSVRTDAAGNLIGRYEADRPGAPAVLLGSRLETVVDLGAYDGPLGVVAGVAVVHALARERTRLPVAVEVAAFADEEGVRFASAPSEARDAGLFPGGSRVVRLPERRGAPAGPGAGLREAAAPFAPTRASPGATPPGAMPPGGNVVPRPGGELLGFLELKVEQGRALGLRGTALGIVARIEGQTRLQVEVEGPGGHAATLPMAGRRDALAAAAEMVLLVERCCAAAPNVVGTAGRLETEPDGDDAIPSTCRFAVDVRAADDADRAAAVAAIREGFGEIARRRRVACWTAEGRSTGEVPCDPGLRARLAAALAAEGAPAAGGGELVGVAGRDAMAMARRCPAAMLLVRAKPGRRALRPADLVSVEDCAAALAAVEGFVRGYAAAGADTRA